MMTLKLTEMPYAQAKVVVVDDRIILVSYQTAVAFIEPDTNGHHWLSISGLYSMTTRRHIGAFVREYCGMDYATARTLYDDGMMMCLETGEVVNIG